MAVLLGTSSLGANSANSNGAGNCFGLRLQCVTSGTVDSLKLRSGPTGPSAGNCHAALYADNAGQLTGATRLSADITGNFSASTVMSFTVTPGVAVTSGTFYWIEWLGIGATFDYTDFAANPDGGTTRDTLSQTTLQATHPATTGSFTNIFNTWAEGSEAGTVSSFTYKSLLRPARIR